MAYLIGHKERKKERKKDCVCMCNTRVTSAACFSTNYIIFRNAEIFPPKIIIIINSFLKEQNFCERKRRIFFLKYSRNILISRKWKAGFMIIHLWVAFMASHSQSVGRTLCHTKLVYAPVSKNLPPQYDHGYISELVFFNINCWVPWLREVHW